MTTAAIVADELPAYRKAALGFDGGHHTINHSDGQYVHHGYTTNTAEAFFSLFKRGVYGTFHHISVKHLPKYCSEFDFRWNGRNLTDTQRRDLAVAGAEGKRLFLYQPVGEA